jgi:hypothetical protein
VGAVPSVVLRARRISAHRVLPATPREGLPPCRRALVGVLILACAAILAAFVNACPSSAHAATTGFSIGQAVVATANLNLRATPDRDGTVLSTQFRGAVGKVIDGPVHAGGYSWWNIDFPAGDRGWTVQDLRADASMPRSVGSKLFVGNRVRTTAPTHVRGSHSLSGTLVGVQPAGAAGTVVDTAVEADGLTWWKIDYDSGPDGWSGETALLKIRATGFTSTEVAHLMLLHASYMKLTTALSDHLAPILNTRVDETNAKAVGAAVLEIAKALDDFNVGISGLLGVVVGAAPARPVPADRTNLVRSSIDLFVTRVGGARWNPVQYLRQAALFKTRDTEYQHHLQQAVTLIRDAQSLISQFNKTLAFRNVYPYPATPNGSHTLVGPHGDYDMVQWHLYRSNVYFVRALSDLAGVIGTPGIDYSSMGKPFEALAAIQRNQTHAQFVMAGVFETNPDPFFAVFDATKPLTVDTPQRLNAFSFTWQAKLLPLLGRGLGIDAALIDAMGITMDAWAKSDSAVWHVLVFPDCDTLGNPAGCGGRGESATPLTPEPSPGFTRLEKTSMMHLYEAWRNLNNNLEESAYHFATAYGNRTHATNHVLVGSALEHNVAAVGEMGQVLGRLLGAKDATSFVRPTATERRQMVERAVQHHLPRTLTSVDSALKYWSELRALSQDPGYQDAAQRAMSGLRNAKAAIAKFDPTLPYKDPYPLPPSPNGSRVLVGPHGDYDQYVWNVWRSTMLLTRVMDGVAKSLKIGSPDGDYTNMGRPYFYVPALNNNAMQSTFAMADILPTKTNRFFASLEALKPLILETPRRLHLLQFEWQNTFMTRLGKNSVWDAVVGDAIAVTLDAWTQTDLAVWSGLLMPDCSILKNVSGCTLEDNVVSYSKLSLPAPARPSGSQVLYRFTATAGAADTTFPEPSFPIALTGASLQNLELAAYDDAGFSQLAFSLDPIADRRGTIGPGIATLPLRRTFIIPANSTKYFELRGSVSNMATSGSIATSFGSLGSSVLQ